MKEDVLAYHASFNRGNHNRQDSELTSPNRSHSTNVAPWLASLMPADWYRGHCLAGGTELAGTHGFTNMRVVVRIITSRPGRRSFRNRLEPIGAWVRRSNPLDRNGEHISHAALGLDDTRRARIAFELAPKAKNLHVDAAIENILMHARGLQQVLAAERALRRIEKGDQQGVLAFGQCHRSASRVGEPASLGVELPAAKSKAPAFEIARRRGTSDIESS